MFFFFDELTFEGVPILSIRSLNGFIHPRWLDQKLQSEGRTGEWNMIFDIGACNLNIAHEEEWLSKLRNQIIDMRREMVVGRKRDAGRIQDSIVHFETSKTHGIPGYIERIERETQRRAMKIHAFFVRDYDPNKSIDQVRVIEGNYFGIRLEK